MRSFAFLYLAAAKEVGKILKAFSGNLFRTRGHKFMGDGGGKPNSLPSKRNEDNLTKSETSGQTNEGQPEGGNAGTSDQSAPGLIGNPSQEQATNRFREESSEATVAARTKEKSPLKTASLKRFVGDRVVPLMTVAFQAPIASYGDAVYDLQKQAEQQFSGVLDPVKRTELIDNQKIADWHMMRHDDYLPHLRDTQARRDLMAYALGDGNVSNNGAACAHCAEIRTLVRDDYWNEVLLAGSNGNIAIGGKLTNDGRLLDPKREPLLWENQAKNLAKLSALLVKDDSPIQHRQEFNRYNPDPKFRLPDEPLPPPADFNHHLPEQFSTNIFVDDKGDPRVFNVRNIQERETLSILHGELQSNLDAEERAVLALHTEVLNQTRPWWLVADGDMIQNANMKVQRDSCRDNILANYKADFEKFDQQIVAIQNKNALTWRQEWNDYKIDAVSKIPSTAQALHFVTRAESAALTDDQMKARGWDTRNQTDAELIRETIRRAQWQHLIAVQSFVNHGILFPQAIGTKQDAELPSAMLIQARALISGTNVRDFRNPSITEDPARHFATRQLVRENSKGRNMQDNGVPTSYPSIFGNSITAPNGQIVRIAPDKEIDTWVSNNLTRWNDHGYPWSLAYVYNQNTSFQPARSQRDALTQFTPWRCDQNNRNRTFLVENANKPPLRVNTPGMLEQNTKDNRALDQARRDTQNAGRQRLLQGQGGQPQPPTPARPALPGRPQLTNCDCTNEWELPAANPFRTYRPENDTMLGLYRAMVIRQ